MFVVVFALLYLCIAVPVATMGILADLSLLQALLAAWGAGLAADVMFIAWRWRLDK